MVSRRNRVWLVGALGLSAAAAVAAVVAGCKSSPNASQGQIQSGYQPDLPVAAGVHSDRLGPNEFHITLVRPPAVDMQENPSWCWAASAAAVLNYHDVPGPQGRWTQDDVVRAMAAHKSDQSGGEQDVLAALTPDLQVKLRAAQDRLAAAQAARAKANGAYAVAAPNIPDASCLVAELAHGNPVIVAIDPDQGLLGHVVVVTGVRFSMASTDVRFGTTAPYFIRAIDAIDPKDGKPTVFSAFTQNPGEERNAIDRVAFAVSRPVAAAYVGTLSKALAHPKWVPNPNPTNPPPNNSGGGSYTVNGKTHKLF